MLQPKKKNSNTNADNAWLQSWLKNRVLPDKDLNADYQKEKHLYVKQSLKNNPIEYVDKIDDDNTQGKYDKSTGNIKLLNDARQGVYTHEKSHAIHMPLQNTQTSTNAYSEIRKNVLPKESIDNQWVKDNYNDITNYNEVMPRLDVYRQNYKLKPDQVITPELIKSNRESYNSNPELFEDNTDQLYKMFKDEELSNTLNNVVSNDNSKSNNIAAYGGKLNISMRNNYAHGGHLTQFNEGGTHEQNPLGGIPQGQSSDGNMNTVEEGETKKGNFIYSNRISLDKDLVKQFNLPTYISNKSVADASKAIDNKFKDRSDKFATETKTTLLNRLSEAQEFVKQRDQVAQDQINQSMQANSQEIPDMMNGEIPQGMEEYAQPTMDQPIAAYGGYQRKYFSGGSMGDEKQSVVTNEAQLEADKSNADNTEGANKYNGSKYIDAYNTIAPTLANSLYSQGNDQNKAQTLQTINAVGNAGASAIGGAAGNFAGKAISGATGLYDMGTEAFGKSKIDTSGKTSISGANEGRSAGAGALKGAGTGAAIGSIIPGVGTLIGAGVGAVLGGVSGLIGGKKDKRAQIKNNNKYSLNYNKQFSDTYAYGGNLSGKDRGSDKKPYPMVQSKDFAGGHRSYPIPTHADAVDALRLAGLHGRSDVRSKVYAKYPDLKHAAGGFLKPNLSDTVNDDIILPDNVEKDIVPTQTKAGFEKYYRQNTPSKLGQWLNTAGKNVSKYAGENYGEAMRYAPVAMNAYQLSQLKKPSGVKYNTLDNRYKPTLVDEARMQRTVDEEANNQINAISQLGGSEGATRNAILAAGLNKNKALSNAYANSVSQNAAENAAAQQFNLGVDSTNVNINNRAIDEMRMDDAAYRGAKSKYLSSIGTDIGNIGKEQADAQLAESLTGYTRKGKYLYKPDGSKATPEEIQAIVLKQSPTSTKQSAYGGYLNIKRK